MGGAYSVTVSVNTVPTRTTTYTVDRLATGEVRRALTDGNGVRAELLIGTDGSRRTSYPDGTVEALVLGPDPRWGMQAPIVKSATLTTPGGLNRTTSAQRTATLANPSDVFSLSEQIDTITVNGRPFTRRYDGAASAIVDTSAAGRQITTTLDAKGQVISRQVAGLAAVAYSYDARGRLSSIRQGSGTEERSATLTYNADGYPESVTDPHDRTVRFAYDLAGRLVEQTRADGEVVRFAYDGSLRFVLLKWVETPRDRRQ